MKHAIEVIDHLYQSTNGMEISLSERNRLQIADSSFTYGEINPTVFGEMLKMVEPKPGEVFYDLGAGTGKAVFMAALLYDWSKCCGIEFLEALNKTSLQLLKKITTMSEVKQFYPNKTFQIEFIHQDILKANFLDADVIYLHATTFGPSLWEGIKTKLNGLRTGTRIIVNTKQLDPTFFEKIDEAIYLMGWGESSVYTYKKK